MGLDMDLAMRRQARMEGGSKAQLVRVPCDGGPSAGSELACHSWGPAPEVPEVVRYRGLGRYRSAPGPRFVWEPDVTETGRPA